MRAKAVLSRFLLVTGAVAMSLAVAEIGLRLDARSRRASVGDLRSRLEASRRAAPEPRSSGRKVSLKGLVQPSPFPDVVYELKPRLDGVFVGGRFRTNSWGFRGPEVELRKPPGTFRIVGIGDSMMFGWGVHQEEIYLARLQRRLAGRAAGGRAFEVLNLAVPGYNTWMEVESLAAKGLAFEPDLVILHFYGNDFGVPRFMQPPAAPDEESRWQLVELVERAFGREPAETSEPRPLLPSDLAGPRAHLAVEAREHHQYMVGRDPFRQAMERLAVLAREEGIAVVVLLLREADPAAVELVREAVSDGDFHLLDPTGRFLDYLRSIGKDESAWEETFQLSSRDRHPNTLGHSLLADALLEFLDGHELIPAAAPASETHAVRPP